MPVDYSDIGFEKEVGENLRCAVEETLGKHPGVPVDPQVVQGRSAAVLTEAAGPADLLVVGRPGYGAFAGMLLGSVSQHCVQHATCLVLVVRDGGR
ncbi:universal stress protein [Streptomyces sp. NBC_00252]|uniref:universal stress protein n=1 Tax=Streptomyces sp. NBC_00252 TaxID=2975691 RepID=UPI002E2AA2C4|nr:universal stress protein [Streptomyces sp. NBC_00252]